MTGEAAELSATDGESGRDAPEGFEERVGLGKMKDEATDRGHNAATDLEQFLAKGLDLGSRKACPCSPVSEFLHEHIGGAGHQDAELVRPEVRAARPIDLESVLEFLDAVLDLPSGAVDPLVDVPGRAAQVGDEEAGVVSRLASVDACDFRFNDDTALARPGFGRVPGRAIDMFGPAASAGLGPSPAHELRGSTLQHSVFGHSDDVVDLGRFQEVEQRRVQEASIKADEDLHAREQFSYPLDHTPEDRDRTALARSRAVPQDCREQILVRLIVEAQEAQQRQIAPSAVEAVEQGELLITVRGIVGGIEIDHHAADPAALEPSSVVFENDVRERLAETVHVLGTNGVLEARECGLRGESIALDGIAPDQHLVDRVVGKQGSIVGIGIAAGDGEHALPEQIMKVMDDLPGLAIIAQGSRQTLRQTNPAIGSPEKDRPAVGAGMGLVELRKKGLGEKIRKQNRLLRGRVFQVKASVVGRAAVASALYHVGAFLFSEFVNFPG